MSTRKERAASLGPAAENTNHEIGYTSPNTLSTANLAQAVDVLFVLAFFPLSTTARIGFTALLERRMERAYTKGANDE